MGARKRLVSFSPLRSRQVALVLAVSICSLLSAPLAAEEKTPKISQQTLPPNGQHLS